MLKQGHEYMYMYVGLDFQAFSLLPRWIVSVTLNHLARSKVMKAGGGRRPGNRGYMYVYTCNYSIDPSLGVWSYHHVPCRHWRILSLPSNVCQPGDREKKEKETHTPNEWLHKIGLEWVEKCRLKDLRGTHIINTHVPSSYDISLVQLLCLFHTLEINRYIILINQLYFPGCTCTHNLCAYTHSLENMEEYTLNIRRGSLEYISYMCVEVCHILQWMTQLWVVSQPLPFSPSSWWAYSVHRNNTLKLWTGLVHAWIFHAQVQ